MTTEPVRAPAGWLALREPADAAARSAALVERLLPVVGDARPLVVHDLGCGTGSLVRWLAPRLPGPQQWVLHDRDLALLPHVSDRTPGPALDGTPVTVETRAGDVTRLPVEALVGADLVTASALLDMLTGPELGRLVDLLVAPGCPLYLALSVTGRVTLTPGDPADAEVAAAFNAHQHRHAREGPRLGPDAATAAVAAFERRGRTVVVEPTPWRLGPRDGPLVTAWLDGWLAAAFEQQPELATRLAAYAGRRREQAAAGGLAVVVDHVDLLVLPA